MLDRGANGGVAGDPTSVRIINTIPNAFIDIQGIDNHTLSKIPLGTVGCIVNSNRGEILLILAQYALLMKGTTIHAPIQFEDFCNEVSDTAINFGGKQRILTVEGYSIPLDIKNGLVYMNSRAFTDEEWLNGDIPHVEMTRDAPWNPRVHDFAVSNTPAWLESNEAPDLPNPNFNAFGEFIDRTEVEVSNAHVSASSLPDPSLFYVPSPLPRVALAATIDAPHTVSSAAAPVTNDEISLLIRDENFTAATDYGVSRLFSELSTFGDLITGVVAAVHEQRERPVDFESFRRFFLNAPREVVQHTFNATTQHYRNLPATWRIMDTRRSHYPAGNKLSRHEGVGTDTIFLDVDSWGRVKCVQFYIGRNSYYMSVHGMYTDGEFVNSLEDEIRFRGAMDTLISDRAQAEISNRVKTILRALYIREWQSEPTKQHQHITERFIQEAKKYANWIRNTSGAPPEAMFHILKYVCFVWNRTARKLLGWRTPCEALTGQTPDVSMLLTFRFWQGCYIKNYQEPGTGFPSQSNEIFVNFLGFAETVGHQMTFIVRNPLTGAILYRSGVRAATDDDANHPANPPSSPDNDDSDPSPSSEENHDPDAGGSSGGPVNAPREQDSTDTAFQRLRPDGTSMFAFELTPDDLVGRTVLKKTNEDGTRFRARILGYVEEWEGQRNSDPERIKFRAKIGEKDFEELIEYNEMCELIEEQSKDENGDWRFLEIVGHTTPKTTRERPKLLVKWESGEITLEPAYNFGKSSSYKWILAEYARDNGLLDEWNKYWPSLHLKSSAKNAKKLLRQINAAKRASYKSAPRIHVWTSSSPQP